ncbi:MAG: hypothetical protein HYU71_03200 [Bacteroidetes bacterium]|nr:hypothetical protein [Bacteroidota bacterium]
MKVYFEVPDDAIERTPNVAHGFGYLDPSFIEEKTNAFIESFNNVQYKLVLATFEKMKFEIMWRLRKIEDKIESEGGAIRIEPDGEIILIEFSDALQQEIYTTLGMFR